MERLRRLLVPALLLAAAAFPAAAPAYSRPSDPSLTASASSAHFQIHYPPYLAGSAQTVLGYAEQAYAAELGMGFPAPLDDGDGHIDIYVMPIGDPDAAGAAGFDNTAIGPSSGWIELDPTKPGSLTSTVVVHELFHLIQFTFGVPSSVVAESTAVWMQQQLSTSPSSRYWPVSTPLDCTPCNLHRYGASPYDRWPFFAFLSDTYGPGIVRDILANVNVAPWPPFQPVDLALRAHGSSLGDAYAAFAVTDVEAGGTTGSQRLGVGDTGSISTSLSIDRLTTRVFSVEAESTAPRVCAATTLTVTVGAQGGDLHAALVVGVPRVQTVVPFAGSIGIGKLTATMPWSPCARTEDDPPIVMLANGSDSSAVSDADVTVQVSGGVPTVPNGPSVPTATGGLTVSMPLGVTVMRSQPYLWADVTVTKPGTLWVRGFGKLLEFPFSNTGTNRIGIKVPLRAGRQKLTFVYNARSGGAAVSLTRTVIVRTA